MSESAHTTTTVFDLLRPYDKLTKTPLTGSFQSGARLFSSADAVKDAALVELQNSKPKHQ
jgi:hypothetical protein